MSKVRRVEGQTVQSEVPAGSVPAADLPPFSVEGAKSRYVGRGTRSSHVTGADVLGRTFKTSPVGRDPVSPEVREGMERAMRVILAAASMTMNPPRNEPGPGGSDPASGVS